MKNRNAFTMIELIMVMVVMGILASLSIPRVKRDERSEAIIHMLSMIRYTQDLALHDSKHKRFNGRWQRAYWRFQIYQCANSGLFYMIGTDKDLNGNLNLNETAIDPSNGKYTFWNRFVSCPKNSTDALNQKVSPNIFITQRYGISSVNFNSCRVYKDNRTQHSNVKHIGFDSFGRPYKSFLGTDAPNHYGYALGDCKITFSFQDDSIKPFTIIVPPESGYAYLEENKNL